MGRLQDALEACLEACCLRCFSTVALIPFLFSVIVSAFTFIVCILCRERREESDYQVECQSLHSAVCKFICEGSQSSRSS